MFFFSISEAYKLPSEHPFTKHLRWLGHYSADYSVFSFDNLMDPWKAWVSTASMLTLGVRRVGRVEQRFQSSPATIYLFKVNNRNTIKRYFIIVCWVRLPLTLTGRSNERAIKIIFINKVSSDDKISVKVRKAIHAISFIISNEQQLYALF